MVPLPFFNSLHPTSQLTQNTSYHVSVTYCLCCFPIVIANLLPCSRDLWCCCPIYYLLNFSWTYFLISVITSANKKNHSLMQACERRAHAEKEKIRVKLVWFYLSFCFCKSCVQKKTFVLLSAGDECNFQGFKNCLLLSLIPFVQSTENNYNN